ncbi:oxidative stress survival, Svf1-like protein [Exidia glandulosa HHB12029]|uniref:Oxidative stress survival, Svf1-like protein n=1 Tax=Exidia glandulosa HHB12029 TaxID=1314781 RepID=A0A165FHH7_EXIGL|nr:oxidative stress survival, Svf1-like protein [Exidia glandulosa HHB12029]
MFSSIFSTSDPTAQNFHPVTSLHGPGQQFSPLDDRDLRWACSGGFVAESQIFYQYNEDGTFIMLQVIHASVGVWFPTIQFVVHVYNPNTKERIWSSTNVSGFTADGRSCKADEFSIVHNPSPTVPGAAESYTITARPSRDVQVSVTVSRTADAPGWKLGKDGKSLYGSNPEKPEGYVLHRFWPRTTATGHVVYKGKAITVDAVGMLVHAIQGMRPNLVASRWNFAHFQSRDALGGVSAIMMEFTTPRGYGPKGKDSGNVKVNIGSVVIGGKLVLVTGETLFPGETEKKEGVVVSRATHLDPEFDKDTSYQAPTRIAFDWKGLSLADSGVEVRAHLETNIGSPHEMKGLVEKVDFLAEVPGPVKGVVSYVSGVKPFIYQWVNPAKLIIRAPGLVEGDKATVDGWLNNEATFISEP